MNSRITNLDRIRIETIDREMVAVLTEKTETERLQIGWGMWRSARRMMLRVVAAEHPEWTESEVQGEVARRMLDRS